VGNKVRLLVWLQRRNTKIPSKADGIKHAGDLPGFWMESLKAHQRTAASCNVAAG